MKRETFDRVGAAGAAAAGSGAALGVAVSTVCCVSPAISPVIVVILGAGVPARTGPLAARHALGDCAPLGRLARPHPLPTPLRSAWDPGSGGRADAWSRAS